MATKALRKNRRTVDMATTVKETVRNLDDLYARAISPEECHRVYVEAIEAANQEGLSFNDRARITLPGLWARYHEFLKSSSGEEEFFSKQVEAWFIWEGDVELAMNYGCLLSVVLGELEGNSVRAGIVIQQVQRLADTAGSITSLLKVCNTQGRIAMQKNDWPGAIRIFGSVDRFRASKAAENLQPLGNIINNRGLTKLNLSDEVKDRDRKRSLIFSAIIDLWNASWLYMEVIPPPLKHIEGVTNRLIMAAIRLLQTEEKGLAETGREAKAAFEAQEREKAKKIILGIDLPAIPPMLATIQNLLRSADEFLAKAGAKH